MGSDDTSRSPAARAVGALLAPVVGPVLGGWLCDNYTWSWVFFINVPMAFLFGVIAWNLLKRYQDRAVVKPVDKFGVLLLIIWVAALQIMLDEGKDKDWFSSMEIRVLAIIAVIGFIAFLIWELTEKHPIVDLRVFRHRGFSSCMLVLALAFGAFFGINVLTPLWLQYNMGYNTTWAGLVVAWGGVLSVVFSPVAAKLSNRVDVETQGKVLRAVHARIPMPTVDEQRAVQLENERGERFSERKVTLPSCQTFVSVPA